MTLSIRLFTACLLGGLLFAVAPASAKKVAGIDVPESLTVGEHELVLNGAGLRKKAFFKLYAGGLYLGAKASDSQAVIDADEPMAISLHIRSKLLTKGKMVKALKEGFTKATGGNTAPIQPQIDQLISLMQDKIVPKDVYTLAYQPGTGTQLIKNGTEVGVVEGLPFKQALFGIWLSDKPAQTTLKKAMLGG